MRSSDPTARAGYSSGAAPIRRIGTLVAATGGLLQLLAGAVLAADPTPSAEVGDPRSPGEGPGLVGDPLLAIGVVVAIGLVALVASLAYVRMTGGAGRT
jgi:hypothetical protein